MVHKITEYIRQYRIINPSDHIIAGVSGGADSVCLFLLLLKLQETMDFTLEIVHVEHGIRGEQSCQDAEFTRKLCEKYKVECKVINVDVPAFAKEKGLGTEEAARLLRYQAFAREAEAVKKEGRQVKVALAHHMDDNAETVIFQLIRGSGLKGMAGISPVRIDENGITYIRPMLCLRRSEIETYLEISGQNYCTDITNMDVEYDRNRLRHRVFPEFDKINDQAVAHINATATQLAEVEDYISLAVESAKKECFIECEKGRVVLDCQKLLNLHKAIRGLVALDAISLAAGRRKDITSAHVEALLDLCKLGSGKQLSLPYSLLALKEYDRITLAKFQPDGESLDQINSQEKYISAEELMSLKNTDNILEIPLPGEEEMLILSWKKYDRNHDQIPKKTYTKWIDYDKIKSGFSVRKRRTGDYFITDSSGHRKKLKQYFINAKIPVSMRDEIWLIARDDEIVDIRGDRLSEAYKVLEDTTEILEIRYERYAEARNGL